MKGWDVAERMGKGEGRRGLDHCSTVWATQGGQEGTMPSGMTLREYAGLLGLCKQRLSFFLSFILSPSLPPSLSFSPRVYVRVGAEGRCTGVLGLSRALWWL